ncbi:unnamed protein product, partial [Mesorhabditis belari]|uniref:Uncharacterized protein n=1 Tax=Mesorhabditis belari TaxID=2138241 RepID=A0AAF3FE52_9BILA
MAKKRSDTMRKIRRDLIEKMRRIGEKGQHRVLVDQKKEEKIGAEEKKNENIIDNNEKVEDENGSFTAVEPLFSRGPSRIRVAPSTLSIDVKNPEKIASLVVSLKKLQAVCRSFESVLSGVLPLSETCVANNKNDGEEKIETVAPNTSLLEFLEEFDKEMSPAVSKESVMSSTDSWISWLPRPISESAIVQGPDTPIPSTTQLLTSNTSSVSYTCDCHLCSYLNGWSMSSIEIDKGMEKLSAGCSCKFLTNGSFDVYDYPSNVGTKEEEIESRKRPAEPCSSDCSCKIVPNLSKRIKVNEAAILDSIQDCVTQVSSWTTSGYMADSETTGRSEIKLGCTCTASTISMPVAPATTPAIEAIDQLHAVQAPTSQTVDQARQFLEHKKALWTLLFIVCDTGIMVADRALRELDGDC